MKWSATPITHFSGIVVRSSLQDCGRKYSEFLGITLSFFTAPESHKWQDDSHNWRFCCRNQNNRLFCRMQKKSAEASCCSNRFLLFCPLPRGGKSGIGIPKGLRLHPASGHVDRRLVRYPLPVGRPAQSN